MKQIKFGDLENKTTIDDELRRICIAMVTQYHKNRGEYDIHIGFMDVNRAQNYIAVEVTYKWRLNAWEKTVETVDHVIIDERGLWHVASCGFSYNFQEHKFEKEN